MIGQWGLGNLGNRAIEIKAKGENLEKNVENLEPKEKNVEKLGKKEKKVEIFRETEFGV